jgi:hypothetical protein
MFYIWLNQYIVKDRYEMQKYITHAQIFRGVQGYPMERQKDKQVIIKL